MNRSYQDVFKPAFISGEQLSERVSCKKLKLVGIQEEERGGESQRQHTITCLSLLSRERGAARGFNSTFLFINPESSGSLSGYWIESLS